MNNIKRALFYLRRMKKFERVKLKPNRSFPEKETFASHVWFELGGLTRSSTVLALLAMNHDGAPVLLLCHRPCSQTQSTIWFRCS